MSTYQDFTFASRRSPVFGRGGMVAASQPLAVAAGLKALQAGGSAADAAVAAAAALNVTEPASTGLGGDCFALYYNSATRSVFALNGSGRCPQALTLERLQREGITGELPPYHPYTVTVPGACAGWCDLVERFGRLPLNVTLAPAIKLAEEGFPVAPISSHLWQRGAQGVLRRARNGQELTLHGRAPRPGEIFRNPGLARSLQTIAESGKAAYYQGPLGEAVVAIVLEAGGCLTMDDLAAHVSTWETPISVDYRGMRVWECPPNGQGLAALLALNLVEGFDLSQTAPLSPQRLHLLIEAMRLAFADARRYVADPQFATIPLLELLSKTYADERRKLIDPQVAIADAAWGVPPAASDTVYLSVVDGEGNACSFINSNYMGFGCGLVPRGFGFALQNRGSNFSLSPESANCLMPGKRPYHTIIPAMITHPGGELYASYGVMGGFMQPQGHLQVAVALLDDGLDPQAALDRPRFCIEVERRAGLVALEEGIPPASMADLALMGHPVTQVAGMERSLFGRGQVIRRAVESGVLEGGSDARGDGCAMCLD